MWSTEKSRLRDRICETGFLKGNLEDIRTAALITTSSEFTPEALEYVRNVAETAAPAIKSLEDKLNRLHTEFQALEAKENENNLHARTDQTDSCRA